MKRIATTLCVLALSTGASAVLAAPKTVTLAVDNMYCALCNVTVKRAIERVDGVTAVEVDYERKQAVVTFEDTKAAWQDVAAASTHAGYPARLQETG